MRKKKTFHMHEIPNRPETESVEMPMPEEKNDRRAALPIKKSREPLLGAALFAVMILFVLASIGGIGWVVYSKWQTERAAESRPSITELLERAGEQTDAPSAESPQATDAAQATDDKAVTGTGSADAAKKLEISILNGGAAKGSAGILADFLKSEGYLKTDAGNTLKDYTGVTIYYAANLEKEAEAIKTSVAKKYPQVKILPADTNNKETSVSQITVIVGK
jgi:hypothetical protein